MLRKGKKRRKEKRIDTDKINIKIKNFPERKKEKTKEKRLNDKKRKFESKKIQLITTYSKTGHQEIIHVQHSLSII